MPYWLLKSEPGAWSWQQQAKSGSKGEAWSGVRNFQAKANLMKMKKGDRAFFYHSGEDKAVVGTVDIVREHYPDPTAKKDEPWVVVDVKAAAPAANPVTLQAIKAEPKLKDMVLVKNSRLSVQPVTDAEWKIVCKMAGLGGAP
jgi:predicted RNA-binding protein with PUA-like domain